ASNRVSSASAALAVVRRPGPAALAPAAGAAARAAAACERAATGAVLIIVPPSMLRPLSPPAGAARSGIHQVANAFEVLLQALAPLRLPLAQHQHQQVEHVLQRGLVEERLHQRI